MTYLYNGFILIISLIVLMTSCVRAFTSSFCWNFSWWRFSTFTIITWSGVGFSLGASVSGSGFFLAFLCFRRRRSASDSSRVTLNSTLNTGNFSFISEMITLIISELKRSLVNVMVRISKIVNCEKFANAYEL